MTENKKTYSIYKHTNKINGMSYIGQTIQDLSSRFLAGHGYCHSKYFYEDIKKYGWDSFTHQVVLTTASKEMANIAEKAMMIGFDTLYPNGYNISYGMSHTPWNKGIPRSNETREKIRIKKTGRKQPEIEKEKQKEAQKGKHFFNNGTTEKYTYECPDGFSPGRLRKWFNNKKEEILSIECPEGFVPGRLKK